MDRWMRRMADRWMHRWTIGRWMHGQTEGWMDGWAGRWMDERTDERWLDGWIGRQMNGWKEGWRDDRYLVSPLVFTLFMLNPPGGYSLDCSWKGAGGSRHWCRGILTMSCPP